MKRRRLIPALPRFALLSLLLTTPASCSTLPTQKELGRYVEGAKDACKKTPEVCPKSQVSAHAATGGITALQAARQALLDERVDGVAAAQAIALPPAALTQCKALGIAPAKAPAAQPAPAAPAPELKAVH